MVACALSEAEDFYFAIVNEKKPEEADKVTTVDTVDSSAFGITMKMIDFNNALVPGKERDSKQSEVMNTDDGKSGMLSTGLSDTGYPTVMSNNRSLSDLFEPEKMLPVNHLFLQSIYRESGYFEYDSTQNFAHLNENGTFTVYDQIGTIVGNSENGSTRIHSQFLPYNDISAEKGYEERAAQAWVQCADRGEQRV